MRLSCSRWEHTALVLGLFACSSKTNNEYGSEAEVKAVQSAVKGTSQVHSGAPRSDQASDGVIVKLRDMQDADELRVSSPQAIGSLRHRHSARLNGFFERHRVHHARPVFPAAQVDQLRRTFVLKADDASPQTMVTELRTMPEVEYAEPNRIHHVVWTPNDPYFASTGTWGQDYRDLWGLRRLQVETAWNSTRGARWAARSRGSLGRGNHLRLVA